MKNKSQIITGACVAALALCGPLSAFAAKAPADAASPAPAAAASPAAKPAAKAKTTKAAPAAPAAAAATEKMPRAIPFRGNATAVNQSGKTFAIAGKLTSRTFKVTDKSAVTKMGNPAKFKELTENEAVTGSYWKQADGTLEVKSLKIGGKTEEEMKKDAEAKAKKEAKKAGAETAPAASPKK